MSTRGQTWLTPGLTVAKLRWPECLPCSKSPGPVQPISTANLQQLSDRSTCRVALILCVMRMGVLLKQLLQWSILLMGVMLQQLLRLTA